MLDDTKATKTIAKVIYQYRNSKVKTKPFDTLEDKCKEVYITEAKEIWDVLKTTLNLVKKDAVVEALADIKSTQFHLKQAHPGVTHSCWDTVLNTIATISANISSEEKQVFKYSLDDDEFL